MLMQKAPIIVLDDSMSAVDTETDAAIRDALHSRRSSCTTFIISHRITTLCRADKILVLEGGRLVQTREHTRSCLSRTDCINALRIFRICLKMSSDPNRRKTNVRRTYHHCS